MNSEIPQLSTAIPASNGAAPFIPMQIPQIIPPPISGRFSNQASAPNLSLDSLQIPTRPLPSTFSLPESNFDSMSSLNGTSRRSSLSSIGMPQKEINTDDFPKHIEIKGSKTVQFSISDSLQVIIGREPLNTEVQIPQGEYIESFSLNKQVILSGQNSTFVSNGRDSTIRVKTSVAQVKGINFKQVESQSAGALLIESGDVLFENCSFYSVLMPAVIVKGESHAFFVNCTFSSQESSCVLINQNGFVSFKSCTFESSVNGCALRQSAAAQFSNCMFSKISQKAISVLNSAKFVCDDSTFVSCDKCCIECKTNGQLAAIRRCALRESNVGVSIIDSQVVILSTKVNGMEYIGVEIQGMSQVTSESNEYGSSKGECSLALYEGAKMSSTKDSFTGSSKAFFAAFGNSTFEIQEATFSDITGNAVVVYNDSTGKIRNSTFKEISETAIMCYSHASVFVNDSVIQSTAKNAAYFKDCEKSGFTNVTFTDNKLNCVILQNMESGCSFEKCSFRSNKAYSILAISSVVTVAGTTFTGNSIGIDGRNSRISIVDSKSTNNGIVYSLADCQTIINNNEISQNANCVIITGGACDIQNTKIVQNSGYGIFATSSAQSNCNNLTVDNNNPIAVVVKGAGTTCSFTDSTFNGNETCFSVSEESTCTTTKCKITNGNLHVDVDGANFGGQGDEFIGAGAQTAIHVHDGSTATLEKCTIRDCQETGIVSSANLILTHSQLFNCKKVGAFITDDATGRIQESVIQSNGDCGIYFSSGSCGCLFNRITGHKISGIKIGANATPEVRGNEISNNGSTNIDRE